MQYPIHNLDRGDPAEAVKSRQGLDDDPTCNEAGRSYSSLL